MRPVPFFLVALLLFPSAVGVPATAQDDAGSGGDAGDTDPDATPVQPGTFEGAFAGDDHVDVFAFEVDDARGIDFRVEMPGRDGSLGFAVIRGPDGTRYPPQEGSATTAGKVMAETGGRWTMEVQAEVAGDYRVTLAVAPLAPQDDAGSGTDARTAAPVALPDGVVAGSLAAYDWRDTFTITSAGEETVTITLRDEDGAVAMTVAQDGRFATVGRSYGGPHPVAWPFGPAGEATIVLSREPTSDPETYVLEVVRSPSAAMPLYPVANRLGAVGGAVSDVDGVVFTRGGALARASATGITHEDSGPTFSPRGVASTADGEHVASWGESIVALGQDGAVVMPVGGDLAFGPDGRLYVAAASGPAAGVHAIGTDRSFERVASLAAEQVAFAPDGTLYATSGRFVHRVDLGGATTVVAGPGIDDLQGLAFDLAGRGYVAERRTGTVHRFDPAGGGLAPFAEGLGHRNDLAFAQSRLFATVAVAGPAAVRDGVAYFETGVEGFGGFTPSFDLAGYGDVQVAGLDIDPPAEVGDAGTRTVTIHVENVGASTVPGPYYVALLKRGLVAGPGCAGECGDFDGDVRVIGIRHEDLALPASGSGAITFSWDTTGHVGDYTLSASVHPSFEAIDADPGNEVAQRDTFVLVGANAVPP